MPDAHYYLTFSAGVIKDLAHNPLPAISQRNAMDFSMASLDTQAPQVLANDGQRVIAIDTSLMLMNFNESIHLGQGKIELHQADDHSVVEAFVNGIGSKGGFVLNWDGSLDLHTAQPLSPSAHYYLTFTGDAIADVAGNYVAALSDPEALAFTVPNLGNIPITTSTADKTGPSITSTAVQQDFLNQQLVLGFNEEVALGNGKIELHKAADGSVVEVFRNMSGSQGGNATPSKASLILTLAKELQPDTEYYLTIAADGVKDLAGNSFAGAEDSKALRFVSLAKDVNAPVLVEQYVYNSSYLVLSGTTLALQFDEKVQLNKGEIQLHKASDGSLVESFTQGMGSADGFITASKNSLNLTTYANLQAGEDYYLTLDEQAVSDKQGNAISKVSDAQTFKFTAPATISANEIVSEPLVLVSQYWDNQLGVMRSADLSISFNNEIQLGAGAIVLHNADTGAIVETFTQGVGSAGGRASVNFWDLQINPGLDFAPATQYYITLDNNAVLNKAGGAFSGFSDHDTLNFFSAGIDKTPPALGWQFSPMDNSTNVPVDMSISLSFTEPMRIGTGAVTLHRSADHSVVESFSNGVGSAGGKLSLAGYNESSVVLDPAQPLLPGTQYYLTIDATALTDEAGNAFQGFTDPTIYNFMTVVNPVDSKAPQLSGGLPADMQVMFKGLDLYLNFNENVQLGQGVIELHQRSDGHVVESFSHGVGSAGGSLTSSKAQVALHLASTDLLPETQYYVTVAADAISDQAGNAFKGISDNNTLNFTTALPDTLAPELLSTFTPDNQTHVPTDANFSLIFNENIKLANGAIELHQSSNGKVVESFNHGVGSAGGQIAAVGSSLSINPGQDLALGSHYYFTVAADAITDQAGNAYAGFSDPNQFNFKTTANAIAFNTPYPAGELNDIGFVGVPEFSPLM